MKRIQQKALVCSKFSWNGKKLPTSRCNNGAQILVMVYTSIAFDKFIRGRSTANDNIVAPIRLINKTTQK